MKTFNPRVSLYLDRCTVTLERGGWRALFARIAKRLWELWT